ncbi:hypothetical protein OHB11_36110 [Streptomyces zaomyceticus]|uniref:Uncharacterized protein n=1 Tax=Streptomyces zaomyceticus TaxID=68286 RepID=A0ABZ1LMB6_9ACTN|nr:hypothetical protein OG237_03765 [Streptomyces zaomyceticus]
MSGHFTDRDERMWQRRAEERPTRPLSVGTWLRALRVGVKPRSASPPRPKRAPVPVGPRPCEQA